MLNMTLYLVGYSPNEAKTRLPFDDPQAAQDYASDFGMNVYTVEAKVQYTSEPYLTYTKDGWPTMAFPRDMSPDEIDHLKVDKG